MWQEIKKLKEERGAMFAELKAINEACDRESRAGLNLAEEKRFDELKAKIKRHDVKIQTLETERDHEQRNGSPYGIGHHIRPAIGAAKEVRQGDAFSPLNGEWEARNAGSRPAGSPQMSMATFFRGAVTGKWESDAQARSIGVGAGGTVLVPTPLSSVLIQAAANKSCLFRAGALAVPMTSATLKMARLNGLPQPTWRAEHGTINSSDPSLDSITFTAKSLAVNCKLSLELDHDSPNADAVIQDAIGSAMALSLDSAGLFGTGASNDPTGIANTTNIQTITGVGNLANYSNFSEAVQRVQEVNGSPNAAILSPNSYGTLDRLVDSLGQPMRKPDSVANLPFIATNQIPLGSGVLTISGSPTGGTFTISVTAGGTTQTTSAIAYNANAATIQAAVQALSNVGSGNATVTGTGPFTIAFATPLLWTGAVKVTSSGASLTGGTAPAATTVQTTTAFVGDFSQVLVGMNQDFYLEISRQAGDSSGSAWTQGQIWIRGIMRADIQIARPNQIVMLSGISTT